MTLTQERPATDTAPATDRVAYIVNLRPLDPSKRDRQLVVYGSVIVTPRTIKAEGNPDALVAADPNGLWYLADDPDGIPYDSASIYVGDPDD